MCTIKIFGVGTGVVTPSLPLSPYEQFLPLPTPISRCFWKDSLTLKNLKGDSK